jgi:hypothetical protein
MVEPRGRDLACQTEAYAEAGHYGATTVYQERYPNALSLSSARIIIDYSGSGNQGT